MLDLASKAGPQCDVEDILLAIIQPRIFSVCLASILKAIRGKRSMIKRHALRLEKATHSFHALHLSLVKSILQDRNKAVLQIAPQ